MPRQQPSVGTPEIWAHLEALSREHGIAFETLLARWEQGKRNEELVARSPRRTAPDSTVCRADPEWMTSEEVAKAWGISMFTLHDLASVRRDRILARLSRRQKGTRIAYKRSDVDAVSRIAERLGCHLSFALGVFVERKALLQILRGLEL